jgi:hypothetical protein
MLKEITKDIQDKKLTIKTKDSKIRINSIHRILNRTISRHKEHKIKEFHKGQLSIIKCLLLSHHFL